MGRAGMDPLATRVAAQFQASTIQDRLERLHERKGLNPDGTINEELLASTTGDPGVDPDATAALKVAARFMAFKYQPKEKKKSKVDRLTKFIREKTGIGRGTAEDIANAIVRGRNLDALARQKNWPVEDGTIEGSKGSVDLDVVKSQLG